ncbi:FeoA family protein [uncultured Desulfuromonas sp.]|uniref:FeoA family protein n=1 Tax=uncultured Desulfuromonas sp. TaxID=181013 RepID=UPI002AAB22B7|nr:FeoA family protein [uncultured Desulfuromonas sp.]
MCPLSQCKSGDTVFVKGFTGGGRLRGKLHAMGLMPGEEIEVISSNCGPLVIQSKGVKLAIGCGMAENILVSCECSCTRADYCEA